MVSLAEPTDLDALRLRNEFLSLPGLVITPSQAARLLDVRVEHAVAILDALDHQGFLTHVENDRYRRAAPLLA